MKIIVCENYNEISKEGAKIIADLLREKPDCILGLATGSTPIGMYKELIGMYEAGEISFDRVTSYNLDEYYPIAPTHEQSYRYFMNANLFDHVNIDKTKTFVPNGLTEDPEKEGAAYDAAIEAAGGVDLQVLGIGQNGHIGFNEPDDALIAGTHITSLTDNTIEANSRFFASKADVPTKAFTMGIGSIMKAKKIILLANGTNKHAAVAQMLDDKITTSCPATILKAHPDVILICDRAALNG
ncbi:MAG: glucosamine-6-phosphate deaminase [Clostridia bacterium]|nr:glucosamine-6-phosphate deaminase [Clostridia bacterium]